MTQPWTTPSRGPLAAQVARVHGVLPVLGTARLRLRAARIEDFETYREIYGGPRWHHDTAPSEEDIWLDFCQLVAGWVLRGTGLMAIEARDDNTLLGFVLVNHEFGDPEMELGWMLTEEAEGHGYAAEAAAALRDHGRAVGLANMVSYISADNARSIRLAERLGAVRDRAAEAAYGDPELRVFRHPPAEGHPS